MYRQDPPKIDLSKFWDVKPEYPFEEEISSPVPSPPANRIVEGANKGIIDSETLDRYRTEDEMKTEEYQKYLNPQEKKPFDFFNFGLKMRGASAGLSWLSGIKERNRQNQYLQQQLSTLGQNVARPAEQPNAYNLYAKYGGKLRNYDGRFSNKAKMRMDKGTPQHSGVFQTHPQSIGRYAQGGPVQEDPLKKKPTRQPIIVTNKNDPRLRAYNDSLSLYNSGEYLLKHPLIGNYMPDNEFKRQSKINIDNDTKRISIRIDPNTGYVNIYKKPVQPVIYQEEKKLTKPSAIPRQKLDFQTGVRPTPDAPPDFQVAQFDNTKPTKYSFSYPTGKYNEQDTIYFPDAGTWKQFVGNQKLVSSEEGKDYGTATGYLKKGGLTPNKAREILHDGTAQGKKLTDKQRRFFGTMSKGHTNFKGRGK